MRTTKLNSIKSSQLFLFELIFSSLLQYEEEEEEEEEYFIYPRLSHQAYL